jgi:hypothetical protein
MRASVRAAGFGWAYGRLGIDARAVICGSLEQSTHVNVSRLLCGAVIKSRRLIFHFFSFFSDRIERKIRGEPNRATLQKPFNVLTTYRRQMRTRPFLIQVKAHAQQLEKSILTPKARDEEDHTRRRFFVLLMLRLSLRQVPVATHQNWPTFLVGLAAALGAGVSMAFAEALSDDGSLTGRGSPVAARVLDCDVNSRCSGFLRALGNCLHSGSVHGHAVSASCVSSSPRRNNRAGYRNLNRGFVKRTTLPREGLDTNIAVGPRRGVTEHVRRLSGS